MNKKIPEWFIVSEKVSPHIMKAVSDLVSDNGLSIQCKNIPLLAHWFMLDSLLLANQANREGMHANALSLTRQCLESLSVIEVGICGHKETEKILFQWNNDKITAGKLRGWLQDNVWENYGYGLWNESWSVFMREFAKALQPYAHYGSKLAQWQVRLIPHSFNRSESSMTAQIEIAPRAYDPQKATRITLFHSILTYVLGRICIARDYSDKSLVDNVNLLGSALSLSSYLDGHSTDWGQQFWAMLWSTGGDTVLE